MDVSIIIINYNTFRITCKCIESIYNHINNVNFEIILVDNASTECPSNLFLQHFPNINLITSKVNLGFAKGNNLGIEKAKGKYILLLNSDAMFLNNNLKIALHYFKENPNLGVLTGQLQYKNGIIQNNCQAFPSIFLKVLEISRLHKLLRRKTRAKLFYGAYFTHTEPIYPDWVWGTYFMFDKNILKKFPEHKLHDDYFMYIEDLQWCYYIRKHLKKQILFNPDIKILHLVGKSGASKNELMKKNYKDFIIKQHSVIYYKILNLFS